ncbi:DNA cytosine methyltransferase [Candidatus Palauibacter sp.]|uniref:DNA cytosine methyltransferase n=1 Tax=Candidatus Palauibacter sp. TaxID=3101350 RepID=UPI003AF22940
MPSRESYNVVNLFVGGGGLASGLTDAGFHTLLAADVAESSRDTFRLNHPSVPFLHKDIRRVSRADIDAVVGDRPVHLVAGGPPCQGFSTIGDQRLGDARNHLFTSFVRVVQWLRPPCCLLENVNYLLTQYAGRYAREIKSALQTIGYRVYIATLNAADFGVPQVRKRTFFFATTRQDYRFAWPDPTHGPPGTAGVLPYETVGSTIMDLAGLSEADAPPNHSPLRHGDIVRRRYELIPEGGRLPPPSELPPDLRRKNFGNTYKRLCRNKPSLTLVPGNNAFPVHPTLHRSLTPREAARLQTFPDTYVFTGNRAEQCRLVGNAVPVELGAHIGSSIVAHLQTHRKVATPQATDASPAINPEPDASRRDRAEPALTAVSYFTGIGGLQLGFLSAGYEVLASYDRKSIVALNIVHNFPDIPHHHCDITTLDPDILREHTQGRRVDVVFGGPPCQGFSIFGRRRFVNTKGHRPEDDPRNELALAYIRQAIALAPSVILMENVKGFLSTSRHETTYLAAVQELLDRAGFVFDHRVLNTADYGVPQKRERVFLVAWRPHLEFRWPQPKYFANPRPWQRPYSCVGDVITDLMDPETIGREFSHVPMKHKELVVERYKLIPEGGRLPVRDLPDHLLRGYRTDRVQNFSHVYRRLSMDQPATTMIPGHNAFPVHPRLPRALTVREAARIQTFPDSIRFRGTRQQQCMLVGNAVPPLIAEQLAQSIAKTVRDVYQEPGYNRDIYDLRAEKAECQLTMSLRTP